MTHRLGTLGLAAGFALLFALAEPLVADTIYRKDGRKVDGEILEETDQQVIVKTKFGPVTIERSDILRIEKGLPLIEQFGERWEQVDRTDPLALIDLAEWCDENRLGRESRKVYREVLKVDTENEIARRELGYVKSNGEWVTKKELADAERRREQEERKSKAKEKGGKPRSADGTASGKNPLDSVGDVSQEVSDFLAPIQANTDADAKIADELFDFFGQKFSVATSEHFSLRAQMPMEEVHRHLALAERLFVTCNKLFDLEPGFRHWQGQYLMFHVKQKGTYNDLIEWLDKHVTEFDAEQKKFFKDGGGLIDTVPNPLGARVEGSLPYERGIAHWVGQTYIDWLAFAAAPPWLSEGFAAYTAVNEFGANEIYCSTNTKYANNVEMADKNKDSAYKLICLDLVAGALDDPHVFADMAAKSLNQLDYADLAKGWSLCDFFMREHPADFKKFVQNLRRHNGDSLLCLKETLGWTAEDLDSNWKEYVNANYSNDPTAGSR